jgi:mitochondrial fission factor
MLENSILPKEAGFVRVSTPPRVITLENHHFPSANDDPQRGGDYYEDSRYFEPKTLEFNEDKKSQRSRKVNHSSEIVINHRWVEISWTFGQKLLILLNFREETPQFGSGVGSVENLSTSHDEVLHLRKQVAKLNRRLLNVEIDNLQRTQREKVICAMGLAYFVLKTIFWLNRK